jgi:hypothetical protein
MRDKMPTAVALEGPEPQSGHWPEKIEPTPPEERHAYPGEGMILVEEDNSEKT